MRGRGWDRWTVRSLPTQTVLCSCEYSCRQPLELLSITAQVYWPHQCTKHFFCYCCKFLNITLSKMFLSWKGSSAPCFGQEIIPVERTPWRSREAALERPSHGDFATKIERPSLRQPKNLQGVRAIQNCIAEFTLCVSVPWMMQNLSFGLDKPCCSFRAAQGAPKGKVTQAIQPGVYTDTCAGITALLLGFNLILPSSLQYK